MGQVLLLVGSAAAAFSGLCALCLAMPKHFAAAFRRKPPWIAAIALRLGGCLLLGWAFVLAGRAHGWSLGTVEWIGLVSVAGLGLVALLPYATRGVLLVGSVLGAALSLLLPWLMQAHP